MTELKITKEKVLKASEQCPDAKDVLETLFPDAFKKEWKDVTDKCKIEWGDYDYLVKESKPNK